MSRLNRSIAAALGILFAASAHAQAPGVLNLIGPSTTPGAQPLSATSVNAGVNAALSLKVDVSGGNASAVNVTAGGTTQTMAQWMTNPAFGTLGVAGASTFTGTVSGTGITTLLAPYAPLASPTFTGTSTFNGVAAFGANQASGSNFSITGGTITGANASGASVTATGGSFSQSLANVAASDGVPIETFHNPVDPDYTIAMNMAAASGVPTKMGPSQYVVNGNVVFNSNTTLIGVPGVTKVVATSALPSGTFGTWFRLRAQTINISGIIFDQAGFGATNNVQNFKTEPTVRNLTVSHSSFRNAAGTLPTGFWLNGDTTLADKPSYVFDTVEFSGNGADGLRVQQAINVFITNPQAHDNAGSGINVNFLAGIDTALNTNIQIAGGSAYNNTQSGVIVGNFTQVPGAPPIYGNGAPSVIYMSITGMNNHGNGAYGIQNSNNNIALTGNVLTGNAVGQPNTGSAGGGGILMSCQYCTAVGNVIDSNGFYGIDAGGSFEALIEANQISNMGLGVNAGATIGLSIKGNKMWNFADKAVNIPLVDSGGASVAFPQVTKDVLIDGNDFEMSSMSLSSYAIFAVDGVQNVNVTRNKFRYSQTAYNAGMRPNLAMTSLTDNANVGGNCVTMPIRAGATTQLTCGTIFDVNPTGGSNWLVIPDVLSDVRIGTASWVIGNISPNTSFLHAGGEVSWIIMTANGSGYNPATTTVSFGGPGTGITAIPYVWNGQVIGIAMQTRGTGATSSTTVTISDTSGGTGATATVQIGVPIPRNRQVTIHAKVAGTLNTTGSFTTQTTPTGANITIPAGTSASLIEQGAFVSNGAGGAWNVENFYH